MLQSEKTFRREIFNYLRKIPKIDNENEKQFTLIFFVLRNFNYMNPRMLLYAFFKKLRSNSVGDDRARYLDDIFHIKQHATAHVCRYIIFVTARDLVSKLKKLEESLKIGRRDMNDEDHSAIYDLFENRLQYLSDARSVTDDDENERPLQRKLGSERPLQMELGSDSDSDISVTLIDSD